MISQEQLIQWGRWGLIPAPRESETDFETRVRYCLDLKETILTRLRDSLPFSEIPPLPPNLWSEAKEALSPFEIEPSWVPVFFSNKQLAPWQGGVSWIFQEDEGSPLGALIQLRSSFYTRSHFLGYSRGELLSHECIHIARMAFDEPEFEEVIAYQTSRKAFRRYFGPIIAAIGSIRLFMILLVTLVLLDLWAILFGSLQLYMNLFWLKLVPLFMLVIGVIRLMDRQKSFKKCKHNLQRVFGDSTMRILLSLTDKEIRGFAYMTDEEILVYINSQDSLRWRSLRP